MAVQQSLDEVIHLNSWMLSQPVLELAERLVSLLPASLNKIILVNTGGEANEIALRIAKMHTGRFEVVGLTRSWHGLQAGTASLNLAEGHSGYGPLAGFAHTARSLCLSLSDPALQWNL